MCPALDFQGADKEEEVELGLELELVAVEVVVPVTVSSVFQSQTQLSDSEVVTELSEADEADEAMLNPTTLSLATSVAHKCLTNWTQPATALRTSRPSSRS